MAYRSTFDAGKGLEPIIYDHPLEVRPLERTHGIILFQDQVNQVAIAVAGFSPLEADQLRRAFGRRNNTQLIQTYWEKFRTGAGLNGIDEELAWCIFKKFNGELHVSRKPRLRLRRHGVPGSLAEVLLPSGVLHRTVQPAAHGLLQSGDTEGGRQAPRHTGTEPRYQQ